MSDSVDIQLDRAIQERIAVAQESLLREDGKGAFSVTYKFGTSSYIDFGSATTSIIAPPAGLRGELKELNVYDVTELFNDNAVDPTGAYVMVGVSGDTNAYATSAGFAELAADAAESFALTDGVTTVLPADTDIIVSFMPSNHGTPAGRASVALTINFFV